MAGTPERARELSARRRSGAPPRSLSAELPYLMIRTLCCAFLLCKLPYLLQAQFILNSPTNRSVIQRDMANRAQLVIAGVAPNVASIIEARLIPMVLGQGTPIDWTPVARVNSTKTFSGTLPALGGWYRVEIRAKAADTIVADTAVSRVGVGEVFVLAGQSNAQGIPQNRVPAATDDRVSCIDLFQRDQIDPQLFPFLFSHASAGANIGPSNSPFYWSILGDSLAKRLNVPILFLGAAQGGSNSTEWKLSAGAAPNTLPYQRLSATLLTYINRLGMRAVLWHQGESDSGIAEQTYFNNVNYIISKSRQQLNHSRLAWLVARASYISGVTNSQVIAAQNRLSTEIADVYAGPATDGLVGSDNRVDDIHFGGLGLVRVANLWNQSLTDQFFSQSVPFIPAADTIRTDAGWQPITTGIPFNGLQRVGYYYAMPSHDFSLLVGATAPVEGRLERLDSGEFTDTAWSTLTSTVTSNNNNPDFSDYGYVRFYSGSVSPGRYRLSVRSVGETGPGYQLETVLHAHRNTLFIGNDSAPTPPRIGLADLSLTMQPDQLVVSQGQVISHQLILQNKGPQSATGVRVQSHLPTGLLFIDSPQASVTALNNTLTAGIDTLRPDESRAITLRTAVTLSGQYVMAAQVTATNQFDPNSHPGSGTADGEDDSTTSYFRTREGDTTRHESPNPSGRLLPGVQLNQPVADSTKADLSLALQTSNTILSPGASLTLICRVTNQGGLVATNVEVQVVLPTGWQLLDPTDLTVSEQTVTGTLTRVPINSSALLEFVVQAGPTTNQAQFLSQIFHVDQADPDSTPGNGDGHGEDDEATIAVRVL